MLCKYGCGEEVTFIDGKPYSLQNHFKVCGPNGRHKKAKKSAMGDALATDEEIRTELKERFAEMQQQGTVE